jgi:hypothetical protein
MAKDLIICKNVHDTLPFNTKQAPKHLCSMMIPCFLKTCICAPKKCHEEHTSNINRRDLPVVVYG